MHEDYYGLSEKPFSLTPDPKYLYKSESHANAFDLLQYAIRRREGFIVVTGDIGTGKTTLCRAVLEQLDRKTFTALVLNPFLSEEDLLRLILQDFGVVSREEMRRGRLAGVSKQDLIDTLNEFLLSLLPLGAGALLIIDEAQNLPRQVLEQIRILSNLETDKEKLLQIVLVGQLNLKELLRALAGVPRGGRTARYRAVAVLASPDGGELDAEATCEGTIGTKPRGSGGFGYDPIFEPLGWDRTMAELEPVEKDRISHRGRALRTLRDLLAGG